MVQSTENPKEDKWIKPFFEKREFNNYDQRRKVCKDFFKYIMEKMEEAVERHRLVQQISGVKKQGTLDEYWPQREALIYLAGGLWRMKFEELGKLHKHYDEKRQAVRGNYPSSVQATLKKQFEERSKEVEYKYQQLQREIDTAKKHLLKRY